MGAVVVRSYFAQYPASTFDRCDVACVTIDMLPDVALLEIFDFYPREDDDIGANWYTLVHVCRKWRNVVFASPRRLNLRLYCGIGTPVRETLGVWPRLPIVVWAHLEEITSRDRWRVENIVAALEHNDRICEIDIPTPNLEDVLPALQQPFPALTRIWLGGQDVTAPVIPTSFLGGSAPSLRTLILTRIPFPGLPKLLSSATHLVSLTLWKIPHSGYISPEAMVACLSVLTRLKALEIRFLSPQSRPDRKSRRPPPPTRVLLPALTCLWFEGVSEYLEDLVARTDAPLLKNLWITFFHQLIFDTPQLTQFIRRTPKLAGKTHDEARVFFSKSNASVVLSPQTLRGALELEISCKDSDWQLSSLAQVCNSCLAVIPAVERLYIQGEYSPPIWQRDVENSQWLELLQSFTAVKGLYISWEFAPRIAPAMQELAGERVMEVLPALQTLFFEEPIPSESGLVRESIGQFVAARQLASQPIAVFRWERS